MAVVLVVAAVGLLVVSALIGSGAHSTWLWIVYVLAQWVGPLLLLAAAALALRRRLYSWVTARLIDMAGPALISAMPPRTVLSAVLARVFGDRVDHQDVLTGLLGGAGRDLAARDTAVSRNTTAHFRLQRIDETSVLNDLTWTHEFSGIKNNHLFIIFATFNRDIAGRLPSARVYPLFESWTVADEDELEDFGSKMLRNMQVGICYRDGEGNRHHVRPRSHPGEEVALRNFEQYVRLPDTFDLKDMRILQMDLHELADPDHVVDAVESLTVRAKNVGPFGLSYIAWSAPYPCYMRRITFDISQLSLPNEVLAYLVVAYTIKQGGLPLSVWRHYTDEIIVDIDAWMLPGHGVTLLWRPVDSGG